MNVIFKSEWIESLKESQNYLREQAPNLIQQEDRPRVSAETRKQVQETLNRSLPPPRHHWTQSTSAPTAAIAALLTPPDIVPTASPISTAANPASAPRDADNPPPQKRKRLLIPQKAPPTPDQSRKATFYRDVGNRLFELFHKLAPTMAATSDQKVRDEWIDIGEEVNRVMDEWEEFEADNT